MTTCDACQKIVPHVDAVSLFCEACTEECERQFMEDVERRLPGYECSGCKNLFDPQEEGVVGDKLRYCGECCNTLDADESIINDMADRMANGASFMEA